MKFSGGWQVDVTRPSGSVDYADVSHNTEKYVVGIPDQPFEVRITAPRHIFQSVSKIGVKLWVDGQSAGSRSHLTTHHRSTKFTGFPATVKGQKVLQQFLFGKAVTDSGAPALAPGAGKTGALRVLFEHIEKDTSKPPSQQVSSHVTCKAPAAVKAIEGKKWFMQPSLCAQAGQVLGAARGWSSSHRTVRQLADLSMRMETATILVLRKVLDPANPVHQAIIDQSQAPEVEEEKPGSCPAGPSASSSVPSRNQQNHREPSRGVKRAIKAETAHSNKAIKPEPMHSPRSAHAAGQAHIIDLT